MTAAPLDLLRTPVRPEWVDYNGHMSESFYLFAFGENADLFFRLIGIDEAYRAAGHSLYTVETHLHHRREVREGDPLRCTLQVLDHDAKRVHLWQEMYLGDSDARVASAEQLLVHVDMAAGRSDPMPPELEARVAALHEAHQGLPVPVEVGRPIGIRRPTNPPA